MKKKVLVIASTFPRWKNDSRPSFVYGLAKEQTKKLDVIVLAPHSKGSKTYEEFDGLKIHRFKYWFEKEKNLVDGGILPNLRSSPLYFFQIPPFIISELFSAIKIVKKENVDIIHAHWIIPQGFTAMIIKLLFGVNYIVTSLGGDMFPFKINNSPLLWLYKKIITQASFATAVNHSFIRELDTVSNKKSYYIPNGVDITKFKMIVSDKKKRNILFVGRLVEKKGVRYLIEALTKLDSSLYNKLLIVGDGPLRHDLEKRVKELDLENKTSFLGNIPYDQLLKLYYKNMFIVVPSIATKGGDVEGFPTVYLDAMASGCPIITTRIEGIETMIKNNQNGIVVEQKDPPALRKAMRRLISNDKLRNALAKSALDEVREKYSFDIVSKQYFQLIEKM